MQLLHIVVNLSDHSVREAQAQEAEKKAEMDIQITQMKIKELETEAKNLQGALG